MQDHSLYKARRQKLIQKIQADNSSVSEGVIFLIAGFERERERFRQESSFYYLTGITEPGVFLLLDFSGKTTLYVPHYPSSKAQWVMGGITEKTDPASLGVDQIKYAGSECQSFTFSPLFSAHTVSFLTDALKASCPQKKHLFTLFPESSHRYIDQQMAAQRLASFIQGLDAFYKDISPLVAQMRRIKSASEIELITQAIECTMVAQSGVSQLLEHGKKESELQATIEYLFTEAGGRPAFPTIVAGGKNGTILHYTQNSSSLRSGDLVVIDTGAELNYYCADITRTYPVAGVFSKRQRQIYTAVLETQKYIASRAQPGYWLNNKDKTDKSLHHLAVEFLKSKEYGQYFTHGIGHFLGLDVHDVGNPQDPLQVGDVITIEPGIYIPSENLGIRIEDDYHIRHNGAFCLSQDLPKEIDEVEQMMQETDEDEYDDE